MGTTSVSRLLPPLVELRYRGHAFRGEERLCMRSFAARAPEAELTCPVVLIVGTSMSAGKTASAP